MTRLAIIILSLLMAVPAFAEEKIYYDEQVDRAALPEDVNNFLSRENTCFTIKDQPQPWDEDQKQALDGAKCEELACVRETLLKKYTDAETQKVITDYNSSLWQFDFSALYDGKEEPCNK